MCLIIDANVLTLVIGPRPDPEFLPIRQALEKKTAIAFFGGQLGQEYLRLTRFLAIIAELRRSGALHRLDDQEVDRQMELFKKRRLASDDPHILAVAEVSKVRLLCSHDKELHADFTNPDLLRPPGSVYQNQSHRHLIRTHCEKHRRRRARKSPPQ